MKINSINIQNIMGIDELSFAPSTVTVLEGPNAAGKSTVLSAIRAVFAGGHDPSLLRRAEKSGRVEIALSEDSGSEAGRLSVRITEKSTTLECFDAQGRKIAAPRTWIESLGDALSVSPLDLLKYDAETAGGRRGLAKALLEIMPLEFSLQDIAAAAASASPGHSHAVEAVLSAWPQEKVDLEGLAKLREQIEEIRRRVGHERDQAQAVADSIKQVTLDENQAIAAQDRYQQLQERRKRAQDACQPQIHIQEVALSTALEALNEAERAERRIIETEYQERLRQLELRVRSQMDEVKASTAKQKADAQMLLNSTLAEIDPEIAAIEERLAAHAHSQEARKQKDQMNVKARRKGLEYERLSLALEILEKARDMKLANSPIQGLVIEKEDVTLDGIPWARVNRARQAEVALQIGSIRAGALRFLLLDDAEHLDAETWAAVKEAVSAAGFQLVAAKVSNEIQKLKVKTEPT